MTRLPIVITCVCLSLWLVGCAVAPSATSDPRELYASAHTALRNGNLEAAVEQFQSLEAHVRASAYGPQGLLELSYAYYKQQDYAAALAAADRYRHRYPEHAITDYALYLQGLSALQIALAAPAHDLKEREERLRLSHKQFATLLQRYPNSAYRDNAAHSITYAKQELGRVGLAHARRELEASNFDAAAARGRQVAQNYPSAAEDANAIIQQAMGRQRPAKSASPRPPRANDAALPSPDVAVQTVTWLQNQNPSHYTVNLLTTDDEKALQRMVRSGQLHGGATYVTGMDRIQYHLVHGIYPNEQIATVAAVQMRKRLGLDEVSVQRLGAILAQLAGESDVVTSANR